MLLIVGIVLGAAFHEFWIDLFHKARKKVNQWLEPSDKSAGETVDGEVVNEQQAETAKS